MLLGQHGFAGYVRSHLAIAQDEVGEDCKHGSAPGALDTPDRDPTQTTTNIMRVAGQTPSPPTGCLVFELEAKGPNEGDHTFEKRFAVFNQVKVGRLVSKIHGDGTVFPW